MKAIYQFLILITICFINYFSFTISRFFGIFFFGSELILVGFFIFKFSEKTSKIFLGFFSSYPFLHYVGKNQLTARIKFIKAFGAVLIALGISILVFSVFD